ncbi:hypothetical protein LTR70_000814 [Exophiala xenobiotica]|uniref:J domain-containing protein n=1 Tax=Lithohypha guttulata TaxID=1690604 RepID=A0ABR0KP68_9EURO|nr:hypothetical protein LTR24_000513 [Lithohypha guttulata]KAK5329317.1 hypothetical protein LTR70_000814 [Exophiala xenobiotica]
MRVLTLHYLLIVCCLALLARCWTKEDHEIFRLRDEVEASEGPDVSFYDFVGVTPSATWEDINKAFRKKSRSIHPDKARQQFVAAKSTRPAKKAGEKRKPGVHVSKGPSQREIDNFMKEATARYSRLGVVTNLLKGGQRERYDHFLRHGFPTWRGTGYYYARYRPGLGTVLVGLFVAGGGVAHYYALRIGYNRQRQFMDKYIKQARKNAWGNDSGIAGIPGLSTGPVEVPPPPPDEQEADPYANLNRRQKREMEKQNKKDKSKGSSKPSVGRAQGAIEPVPAITPQGQRRRVTAENGKQLLVDSVGNVFLIEEVEDEETGEVTSQEMLLDMDDIHKPTVYDAAVVRLPMWLFRKAFDPFMKGTKPISDDSVPLTEAEVEAEARMAETKESTPEATLPASMSASQDFEMIDSSSVRNEMNTNGAKKRTKKGKK